MSNLLLETEEFNEATKESMQMITASGDLLLTVVNDVLDVAKLASDKVAIHIERTNLNQAITTVIRNIQLSGKGKKVSFNYFCHNDVPAYLDTDSRRLQQVVYNLVRATADWFLDHVSACFSSIIFYRLLPVIQCSKVLSRRWHDLIDCVGGPGSGR